MWHKDIRRTLKIPALYRLFSRIIGARRALSIFIERYVRPKRDNKILDIGCGPGDILEYLPDVDYCGFDMDRGYIDAAIKRFGKRGTFLCKKVNNEVIGEASSFDIVLAIGILHHLDDDEAVQLFQLARSAMIPSGRLVTMDGCYVDGQSGLARRILSKDRGRYVRTREAYAELASGVFPGVKVDIYHDLLRIPFTHIIMECAQ
jgi:SAM-dependent methyltransferase